MRPKTRQHLSQNEPLLFERSSPGKKAYQLPQLDVPAVDAVKALGEEHVRDEIEGFPEVSEVEAIRHFTRLSTWNYAIDHGMYPLGSCTMKYNPRINEIVARLDGLAWAHPYQPEALSQGAMSIIAALEAALTEITGMDAVTLQPAAGAHGELTGILMIRALLESRGNPRRKLLIPDSAHGTNPATASMAGYQVENLKSNGRGMVDVDALAAAVNEDVAALMITNPNTLGVFEQNITRISEILHAKGALVYMDGANMNALVGITRPGDFGMDVMHLNLHKTFSTPHGGGGPGSGPVAVKKELEPFFPGPRLKRSVDAWIWNYDLPQSIGRVRAFYGNFGVLARALAYIMAHGSDGLRRATMDAVLNAIYIRKNLDRYYDLPLDAPSMHEVVFSDEKQARRGVRTGDLAKRLIDYGFHPYTVSFPLIVKGALMIEPTETEGKIELDAFIDAMISIAHEVEEDPEMVLKAPYSTRTSRVDEVSAARKPVLRWRPQPPAGKAAD
ncbi:MAG: aminomethyl-transferring glycine dehydrogenase subunit GcvPB [Bryobacteraceae bacterium]|nr:aminomethyl-transferring glycine dehydrogenase subunit GcvPB [Bryobacterales bacterium]MEB2361477.1 aminomethyl-transferring glycine dehydrogenase subunit GcvPB [Bryobacterales bacterium]NUN01579.1 aminomethyl-transferring glycine dehydrogenase subunit GcvPB [Bryobacteraceae bacterium]